jgi:hypothetical protein
MKASGVEVAGWEYAGKRLVQLGGKDHMLVCQHLRYGGCWLLRVYADALPSDLVSAASWNGPTILCRLTCHLGLSSVQSCCLKPIGKASCARAAMLHHGSGLRYMQHW